MNAVVPMPGTATFLGTPLLPYALAEVGAGSILLGSQVVENTSGGLFIHSFPSGQGSTLVLNTLWAVQSYDRNAYVFIFRQTWIQIPTHLLFLWLLGRILKLSELQFSHRLVKIK